MTKFAIGFIVGILILPAAAFFYVWRGYAPVATAAPPLPLEKRITHIALNAQVERHAPKGSPVQPTEANLMAGAKLYREYCAVCHGLANQPRTAIAVGMFPPPPQLMRGKGVTDDPVGETYWKVANGIRLSGMPGFRNSLSDDEVWQASQFLANADKLPESVRKFLSQPPPLH